MRTGGHGNDFLMVLVPLAVILAGGMMYFGGPSGLMKAADDVLRTFANSVAATAQAWF